ncbi:MAG: BrnA antitoxin family protein [Candidatus Rokubacteria bacterium]|nr:BrnA antitoxin family protein [Candidatus Rokubacteria bacterium]
MKKEYDFSKAKRGVFRKLPPLKERARYTKVRITIMVDLDVLDFFKKRATEPGAQPYQTQINQALREYVFKSRPTLAENLLKDESFISRISERIAEYSARGVGPDPESLELARTNPYATVISEAWETARRVKNSSWFDEGLRSDDDEFREPFQLLVGSLISTVSGLKERRGKGLDKQVTSIAQDEWRRILFERTEPPCFGDDPRLGEAFGNMHSASVSFRLVSAVFFVHRLLRERGNGSPFSQFEGNLRGPNAGWKDAKLSGDQWLREIKKGRFKGRTLDEVGKLNQDALPLYLVIVNLHRDHFAHGHKERAERRKAFEPLLRRHLIQAQLQLINWGLSTIAKLIEVGPSQTRGRRYFRAPEVRPET